ncbi:MAG: hypothetical protein IJ316_00925 [Clostridia bacterium]|nr:hypothetical protein [Clostridia bacterium]
MLKNITSYIKQNRCEFISCVISIFLFAVFTTLFSFFTLQSDDYYYASFFKNGISEFIRLSVDHFLTFNGRALVHFFAQVALSLPRFLTALMSSVIVMLVGVVSHRIILPSGSKKSLFMFMCAFYSLILLCGRGVFKEGFMWVSAFYNYVFPFLLLLLAVKTKDKNYGLIFCFLSGATTEQWGICAIAVLAFLAFVSLTSKRDVKTIFKTFIPTICTALGYMLIYTSPATIFRITSTGHTSLSTSIVDIPRLSEVFLAPHCATVVFALFTIAAIITAHIKKGSFSVLYCGYLPLVLLILPYFTKEYLASFIVFMCFLFLCAVVFFINKHIYTTAFIIGSLVSTLIMLPTNTFETRVGVPCVLFIIVSTLSVFAIHKKTLPSKFHLATVCLMVCFGLFSFAPTFTGFMQNGIIEHENLNAIKVAKQIGTLDYNIDYNKDFAMKQMYNDGWFYNQFISLYSLEDCRINIKSKNSVSLDLIEADGLKYNGEVYVPVRDFLSEMGGTINLDTDIVMTLNDKTLTLSSGMLVYKDKDGIEKYLIADENKLPEFYTLYIKLDVINEAFNLNIKAL